MITLYSTFVYKLHVHTSIINCDQWCYGGSLFPFDDLKFPTPLVS